MLATVFMQLREEVASSEDLAPIGHRQLLLLRWLAEISSRAALSHTVQAAHIEVC